MSITVQAASKAKEAPVEVSFLQKLVEQEIEQLDDKQAFIGAITTQLGVKSSRHKFLVELVTLKGPASIDVDLTVSSSIGALWDSGRDGYCTLKIATEHTYLVTIYWIYAA